MNYYFQYQYYKKYYYKYYRVKKISNKKINKMKKNYCSKIEEIFTYKYLLSLNVNDNDIISQKSFGKN